MSPQAVENQPAPRIAKFAPGTPGGQGAAFAGRTLDAAQRGDDHGDEGSDDIPDGEEARYGRHQQDQGKRECVGAREHGGKPATWHGRRFGHYAVNELTGRIIRCWRVAGDAGELAEWVRPIEAALAGMSQPEAEKRADVSDAEEDRLQALYRANPCAETARDLLRARARERTASLDHDREIAARYGIEL
jgi:hypothetical protein